MDGFLAETASIFGEITTFNHLKSELTKNGDKKALFALIMGKIDESIGTVVRQIGFSNFERRLHGWDQTTGTWQKVAKRSVEEVSVVWDKTIDELYGDALTRENTDKLWAYIGHFHRPFYVYGYAFGELLVHSLYAKREALGERFAPLYLDMLRAGGSKDVVELLKPFGLDPSDLEFWNAGIEVSFGKMIPEAESLARELKLIS